jgi:nitroreductase
MDFFELISQRHSVRNFGQKEVEKEKLNKILEAADMAPSAGNLQAYEIVVVSDLYQKTRLCEACLNQQFVAQAPVVLVFCENRLKSEAKYGPRGHKLYALQDATIACAYAQLACAALGLSSCWVGAFNEEMVKKLIDAPVGVKPIAVLPIGYANEEPYLTPRREIKELAKKERF